MAIADWIGSIPKPLLPPNVIAGLTGVKRSPGAMPHAINARCRIAMQSATYAEICADIPTLFSTRRRAQIHRSSAHPAKAFRPGMLEP